MQELNEQPNETEDHAIVHEPRYWIITALAVVATALLVGGGVWWWMNGKVEQVRMELKTLQEQLQKDGAESMDSTTNIFDPFTAEAGDQVADMTISSIRTFDDRIGNSIAQNNMKVVFSGEKEISGVYSYIGGEIGLNLDCFSPSDESAAKLPIPGPEYRRPFFCFENQDSALLDQVRNSAHATILIDEYTLVSYPAEVTNTAELVSVVGVQEKDSSTADWKTYQSTEFGFSFSYPNGWSTPFIEDIVDYQDIYNEATVEWNMNLGPIHKEACEGSDCYDFYMRGLRVADADNLIDALIKKAENPDLVIVYSDDRQGNTRKVTYSTGGICGYKHAYLLYGDSVIELTGRCALDDSALLKIFDGIVSGFKFTN